MSLLVALLLLQSCESGEQREYRGNLYFGTGAYLGRLDLRNGNVALLANLGDTAIREVAAFGDDQLLLSVFGPVNHKDTFRLMQYELAGGGLATLLTGRHGRYLPGPEALVFDDGAHLKMRVYGGRAMKESIVTRHRVGASVHILQVSGTGFVYGIDFDTAIHSADVETGESRPLHALSQQCALDGALWIARRDALLCKQRGADGAYKFVSLSGEVLDALDIPGVGRFRAVAHLHDQDALVLTEAWKTIIGGNTRYAVWIYDLSTERMVRLVKDQTLGLHVVYHAN
ncbi:MAG: hypothetical protein EX272_00265 [Chromatiales bacterium]|nr:MAG: hypothetical protein EX272_00265 [Chromatiales bacterium]